MAAQKPASTKTTKSARSIGSKTPNKTANVKTSKQSGKASQAKTRPTSTRPKPKRRVYSEQELNIPTLNMITPAGVIKPRGKKKGKIFVDDQESMMTILAMVNAEKEGEIESKITKSRHMEELREARRKEAEARQEERRGKFEEAKDSFRTNRQKKHATASSVADSTVPTKNSKASSRRVSFG